MRVVKSPFHEVDLWDTTNILGTELYQPGLASAGVGPKADYSPLYLGLRRGRVTRSAHFCIPGWSFPTFLYQGLSHWHMS